MVRLGQLLMALLLAGPATAAPRIPLPLFGLSVVLPDGWTADIPPAKPIPAADKDHDFQTQVEAVCKTEACDKSREVCTIRVYDEVMQTWDVISNALLFPRQADMDKTTNTVLDWTSVGATVRRPLGKETIETTSWYTIETDPSPGYKAVLHARTVMKGRFLWALCRTCSIDDPHRFDTARGILASIRVDEH